MTDYVDTFERNGYLTEHAAWHFTSSRLHDGRPIPPAGEWLVHEGEIVIGKRGLHASERLFDALTYAPGGILHRVTVRGIEDRESDKLVVRLRRIEWSLNAETVLRAFARCVALDVAHLWDMPPIVRQYLETGDETLRYAAWSAARSAARSAAGYAAWSAVGNPVWAASAAAARNATAASMWAASWVSAGNAESAAARGKYNGWLTEMVEAAHAEASHDG